MNRFVATIYVGCFATATGVMIAEARPVYARQEAKPCGFCHVRASGGGERGFRGLFYGANGLSLLNFDEKRESSIAGVSPEAQGVNSIPAHGYNGNISGPAAPQIQLASLRGPVFVVFLSKADKDAVATCKALASVARAYGPKVTVLGVTRGAESLELTKELGNMLRVFPDPEGVAAKKFSAQRALDFTLVAKLGDPIATYQGFSKSNLEQAMHLLSEKAGIPAPKLDLALVPTNAVRGDKLSGNN